MLADAPVTAFAKGISNSSNRVERDRHGNVGDEAHLEQLFE
jgi:hypothetical protein